MESATAVYYIKTTFIGSFGSVFQKIRPEKVYGNLIDPCQVSSLFPFFPRSNKPNGHACMSVCLATAARVKYHNAGIGVFDLAILLEFPQTALKR